jgi:hypothetical protein
MRRPVIIASILALLSACDKPQEQVTPDVPAGPLTAVSPTSTLLFQVYGSKDAPRIAPIAIVEGGQLAPLTLDAAGWRSVDSTFFAQGAKLTVYRDGAANGTVEVLRGMWPAGDTTLYSLPGCTNVVPQALGRLAVTGFVEASVEYLASTTPLAQTVEPRISPVDARTAARTFANTIAASSDVGNEELASLEFVARWLRTGAGPKGRTLLASFIDPNAGDTGPGAGHTVMLLALAEEDSSGALASSYQHVSQGEGRAVDFQRLVNHADIDGDGIDEIIVERWRYAAVPEIAILKYAGGKWTEIFRHSENWCLDTRKPAP